MTRSDSIAELSTALGKAQRQIVGASRSSTNPHYHSRYADLAATWDACREQLTSNGLAVIQCPRLVSAGAETWLVEVETMLVHASGEYLADTLAVPVSRADAQGVGSAITYARRYALAAFVGVAPDDDDDDGEAAVSAPVDREREPYGPAKESRDREPEAPIEVERGKVADIVQRRAANNAIRYVVTLANGHKYASFRKTFAETAKAAREAGSEVEVAFRQTRFGPDIVNLVDLSIEEPPI